MKLDHLDITATKNSTNPNPDSAAHPPCHSLSDKMNNAAPPSNIEMRNIATNLSASMPLPNLRWNAFTLGVRLLFAAANPWSGLDSQVARKAAWQPVHPFGLPRWFPLGPVLGKEVGLDQLQLMRSVLPSADEPKDQ